MYVFYYYLIIIYLNLTFLFLGLNGGVCRSTAIGGVNCTCPAGYTGIRWYVKYN